MTVLTHRYSFYALSLVAVSCGSSNKDTDAKADGLQLDKIEGNKPKNVIYILSDDHRYDFMGFLKTVPWLQTPNMDRMAREGVHCENTVVTTALSSPSRASILTGQYTHTHGAINNFSPEPEDMKTFPRYLQKAGYNTGFFGKWHIGGVAPHPRPGFDEWVCMHGHGTYFAPKLNINGVDTIYPDSVYLTDLLTDMAIDWLEEQDKEEPFMLYLSHKAVHHRFKPAPRHDGMYRKEKIDYPATMYPHGFDPKTEKNLSTIPASIDFAEMNRKNKDWDYQNVPNWVKEVRKSYLGVDNLLYGNYAFDEMYYMYSECLKALDESIGTVMDYLEENDMLENTIVIYMGDNGYSMGEHGMINKCHAYEESMKVPLLVWAPGQFDANTTISKVIQNIDIAPTIMELAGLNTPTQMEGQSFLPLLKGEDIAWRDKVFYEYYWLPRWPQLPTTFAVRSENFKYIHYHGRYDMDEFFDMKNDPLEMKNLINDPKYKDLILEYSKSLQDWQHETKGNYIPLKKHNLILGKRGKLRVEV